MMLFNNYRSDPLPLVETVEARLVALDVSLSDRKAVWIMLAPLSIKYEAGWFHYAHSLRVGLLAAEIARHEGVDERALLLAGLLHDVGKALVPACTLSATERWTAEDKAVMEEHVSDGFRMLRDRFDFTAQVILWHHRFQASGYPEKTPNYAPQFSVETLDLARRDGILLMVADVFDALHRVNSATEGCALSGEAIRTKMLALHPALLGNLVSRLYAAGVLRERR